jgi:hypothetical protein
LHKHGKYPVSSLNIYITLGMISSLYYAILDCTNIIIYIFEIWYRFYLICQKLSVISTFFAFINLCYFFFESMEQWKLLSLKERSELERFFYSIIWLLRRQFSLLIFSYMSYLFLTRFLSIELIVVSHLALQHTLKILSVLGLLGLEAKIKW